MKNKTKRRFVLVFLCYFSAILLWFCLCAINFATDAAHKKAGNMVQKTLAPQDFASTSGIKFSENWQENSYFVSTDRDPQLHLIFDKPTPLGQFVFFAQAKNKPGGEMALYYTTKSGQAFSEKNRQTARQNPQGQWYFDFDGKKVLSLRLDPDSAGGVYWQVEAMLLNAPKPFWAYFVPDALELALVLFAPLLLAAVLAEASAFFQPLIAKRRLAKRFL